MPKYSGNIDSTESASNTIQIWQPIGRIAKSLLEKSVAAINAGQFEIAETYHAQAVEAETGPQGGDI